MGPWYPLPRRRQRRAWDIASVKCPTATGGFRFGPARTPKAAPASDERSPSVAKERRVDPWPRHPSIYEINTWVWLGELGRGATLASVPDAEWDAIAALGFD